MGAWLAAAPGAAQASTRAAAPQTVLHAAKAVNTKAVLAYWTPARLRSAKSVDVIVAGSRPHVLPPTNKTPGKPGHVAGGRAGGQASFAAHPATVKPAAFSYPYPYDSFTPQWALWRTYPYEVNGKLFFTNNGGNYVCSATSVASASGTSNENEIWTAGHCAANTSGNTHLWDSSAIFIPAYNGNVSNFDPFGEFVWTGGAITSSAWFNNSDLTEDEAAMTVGTSTTTGRTLGQSVGWDGFAWNWPVNQQFVAFGYPAASPYNGANLVEDIGATAGQDGNISGADPTRPIVIGNPMTGGSSGGAWNIGWSSSNPGYINGHNDYKYTNQPLAMYSPYQDSLSNLIRCFNKSSC
ncbi:MAG TPA: hypothetical protein VIP48_18370 [Streptosporangiaceae bacterium]